MKIKLTTNTPNTLLSQLSLLQFEYGFSYSEQKNMTNDTSFLVKFFSKLNSLLKKDNSISKEDINILHTIANITDYINTSSHIQMDDNMGIQVNVASKNNNLFFNILTNFLPFSNLSDIFNNNDTFIYFNYSQIVLGVDKLKGNKGGPFLNSLKEHLNSNEISEFILFHELSHSLEISNNKKHHNENSPLASLFSNLNSFKGKNIEEKCQEINDFLRMPGNNPTANLGLLNHNFISNLVTVQSEMYADVSALFLMRNYHIEKKDYSIEIFDKYIHRISQARHGEYKHYNQQSDFFIDNLTLCHFTPSSFLGLTQFFETLGEKPLNDKEIHNLAQQHVMQGLSYLIIGMVKADKFIEQQLNTLFSIAHEGSCYHKLNTNIYHDTMTNLYNYVNPQWIEQLNHDIKHIETLSLPILQHKKAIFEAALLEETNKPILESSHFILPTKQEINATIHKLIHEKKTIHTHKNKP